MAAQTNHSALQTQPAWFPKVRRSYCLPESKFSEEYTTRQFWSQGRLQVR